MHTISWDQPATLIDLDGKTPITATVRECVMHFAVSTPQAQQQARILLTRPVLRAAAVDGRKARTWLLDPAEIAVLVARLETEE